MRLSLIIIVSFFITSPCSLLAASDKPVLRVMNWTYFIAVDDDADESLSELERSPILQKFMKQFDCEIEYLTYESEEDLKTYLIQSPHSLDVFNTSHSDAFTMAESGFLETLSLKKVPNKKHLDPEQISSFNPDQLQFISPYFSGTAGIIYRKDLVGEKIHSWKSFFEPKKELYGKINILNSYDSIITNLLMYQHTKVSEADPAAIRKAARVLYNMRESGSLQHVSSDLESIFKKLKSGELAMSVMYLGDALGAIEEDKSGQLEYVVPDEGCEAYLDCWVVNKNSRQKKLALAFVNYMLDPEVHATNAAYLMCPCPNVAAKKLLSVKYPELMTDTRIYPTGGPKTSFDVIKNDDLALDLWNRVIKGR
ncbi:MAG: spermidine/putrescine ABC transporter substrate-binding protein [Planctomycetes bacterium]|nr:spermidine/putrescine ABC transporter substrate-binding protein [Planctomycetota bacterium]